MAAKNRYELAPALRGGILAGVVAGLVMALGMLVMNLVRGNDIWLGMKGAGIPFLGERAMQPGFDALAVAVGVAAHMGISVFWGGLFGMLAYGLSRPATVAAGAVWGIVVWLGMYYVALPLVGLGEIATSVPMAEAVLSHVFFGLVIGLAFLPYQRRIVRPIRARMERPVVT